jgi:Phage related hypothetical protein (DUF1799)
MFMPSTAAPINGFDLSRLYAPEEVDVWPENWPAVSLFSELQGQWRPNYASMDYGVLFARMDRMRLSDADWRDLYDDVRAMERAAIEQLNAQRS